MLGVFGVSGSGKSVMAVSLIAGFSARSEMGMLIIDPQAQFSGFEMGNDPQKWSWRLDEAFRLTGRGPDVQVVHIDEIALESPVLFVKLLDRFGFFEALSVIGHDKREQLAPDVITYLAEWLREDSSRTLGHLEWSNEILKVICTIAVSTYADPEKQAQKMLNAFTAAPFKITKAQNIWGKVKGMFNRRLKLGDLLDDVLIKRKIVILDIDADEGIKDIYCSEILDDIKKKAEMIYRIKQGQFRRGERAGKYKDAQTNALIVIDEAHRFAPQSTGSNKDQERMVHTLVDAIKTTRKLGVGWCYITQSIASFNKDVFRQIQTKVLGVGIGTGADDEHLEAAFNKDKDLIARYRNLPRPITTKVFPFAVIGELVALGNGSRALFISAPNTQKELFGLNPGHFKYANGTPVSDSSTNSFYQDAQSLPGNQRLALAPPIDDIPF